MPNQKQELGEKKTRLLREKKKSVGVEEFHFPPFFDQPSEISVKCKIVMKILERMIFDRYKVYA